MTDKRHSETQGAFDQIFSNQTARLVGVTHGIEGLSFNLVNLSCLVLLAERENELKNFPDDSLTSYVSETLEMELTEMGIDLGGGIAGTIADFVQKGYVSLDNAGQLKPEKPALSTVKMIERAFPKMPGLNLVGYFLQTIDEVISNRKSLKEAADQFDQTLSIHGMPLVSQAVSDGKKQRATNEKRAEKLQQISDLPTQTETAPFSNRMPNRKWHQTQSKQRTVPGRSESDGPSILSANSYAAGVQIQTVQFGKGFAKEVSGSEERENSTAEDQSKNLETQQKILAEEAPESPEYESPASVSGPASEDLIDFSVEKDAQNPDSGKLHIDVAQDETEEPPYSEQAPEPLPLEQEVSETSSAEEPCAAILEAPIELESKGRSDESGAPPVHDLSADEQAIEKIEKRIADFEEDLARQCPVCKKGRVDARETSTGKLYYTCSSRECSFISWGKPHHIACPRCQNTFLIEVPGQQGENILKCPRATCRYQQALSGHRGDMPPGADGTFANRDLERTQHSGRPKRKVVRRRRVRKKK